MTEAIAFCRFSTPEQEDGDTDIGIARFEFEDLKEATMFWLAN